MRVATFNKDSTSKKDLDGSSAASALDFKPKDSRDFQETVTVELQKRDPYLDRSLEQHEIDTAPRELIWQRSFGKSAPKDDGTFARLRATWLGNAPITQVDHFTATREETHRVWVSLSTQANSALAAWNKNAIFLIYALLFVEGFLLVLWVSIETLVIRRVTRLARATEGITDPGALRTMPEVDSGDELGVLSRTFVGLIQKTHDDAKFREEALEQRREADFQEAKRREEEGARQRQSETEELRRREQAREERLKIESWRLRQIGHNIKSPLNSLSILLRDTPQTKTDIDHLLRSVELIYESESLPQFIGKVPVALGRVDLNDYLDSIVSNAAVLNIGPVRFISNVRPCMVNIDENQLGDVCQHILSNAQRLKRVGSLITIALSTDDQLAIVSIDNEGETIEQDDLERIFDLDVSLRPDGSGRNMGSGLFQVRSILARMDGTVVARNTRHGVAFDIRLPLVPSEAFYEKRL
jgi:signal transduction histidine kinase